MPDVLGTMPAKHSCRGLGFVARRHGGRDARVHGARRALYRATARELRPCDELMPAGRLATHEPPSLAPCLGEGLKFNVCFRRLVPVGPMISAAHCMGPIHCSARWWWFLQAPPYANDDANALPLRLTIHRVAPVTAFDFCVCLCTAHDTRWLVTKGVIIRRIAGERPARCVMGRARPCVASNAIAIARDWLRPTAI
jgi:hypothetical protein